MAVRIEGEIAGEGAWGFGLDGFAAAAAVAAENVATATKEFTVLIESGHRATSLADSVRIASVFVEPRKVALPVNALLNALRLEVHLQALRWCTIATVFSQALSQGRRHLSGLLSSEAHASFTYGVVNISDTGHTGAYLPPNCGSFRRLVGINK